MVVKSYEVREVRRASAIPSSQGMYILSVNGEQHERTQEGRILKPPAGGLRQAREDPRRALYVCIHLFRIS